MFCEGPVFAIPTPFNKEGHVDYDTLESYLKFLEKNSAKTIMTTVGTSQFNLLSKEEIRRINKTCCENFQGKVILGTPPMSHKLIENEIEWINCLERFDNIAIMLLYPERYYNDTSIVEYFYSLADISNIPVFIHGMYMRHSVSGLYDFSSKLINKIAKHDNIIGMKEETSDLSSAYNICKNIDKNFEIIVAGGSQRRFSFLHQTGATTFLTGVGNLFPQIDIDFYNEFLSGNIKKANEITRCFEDVLFDVFMKIGWHKSLRSALKIMRLSCYHNRNPFPDCTETEHNLIKKALDKIGKEREHNK